MSVYTTDEQGFDPDPITVACNHCYLPWNVVQGIQSCFRNMHKNLNCHSIKNGTVRYILDAGAWFLVTAKFRQPIM